MPSPDLPDIVVPLVSRRKSVAQLGSKIQHGALSIGLLLEGLERLGEPAIDARFFLGAAEVLTAGFVLASFVRAIRVLRKGDAAHGPTAGHSIDWVDVSLGGMFLVEAITHHHDTGHWPRPMLLLSAVSVGLGLMHGRVLASARRRRSLRITREGLQFSVRKFRTIKLRWTDIAGIRVGESRAIIATTTGAEHALDLNDLHEAPKIRAALDEAQVRLKAAREIAQ